MLNIYILFSAIHGTALEVVHHVARAQEVNISKNQTVIRMNYSCRVLVVVAVFEKFLPRFVGIFVKETELN